MLTPVGSYDLDGSLITRVPCPVSLYCPLYDGPGATAAGDYWCPQNTVPSLILPPRVKVAIPVACV